MATSPSVGVIASTPGHRGGSFLRPPETASTECMECRQLSLWKETVLVLFLPTSGEALSLGQSGSGTRMDDDGFASARGSQ
jgi:hypothetical protein